MSITNVRGGLSQSEPSIVLNKGAADQLTVTHPANNTAARVLTYPDQDYDYSLPAVKHGGDVTKDVVIDTSGATTAKTISVVSSHTDNRTLTLPDATDTIVGRATTDTLTNKTLTAPSITGATLSIPDTDSSHNLTLTWNEAEITSDRILNFLVNGAARTINLTGNLTLAANLTTTTGAITLAGNVAGSTLTLPATGTVATTALKLSDFAATTSAELAGAISDETGSGLLVFGTSPTLITPVLGTPSSGTLTSCTGLPIATGVSGLGTNVSTFLATPSSANLAAALTDETGTGLAVFGTSPVLTAPTITTGGSIDVTGAGSLTIGASIGANNLTLGGATSTVVVAGNLQVDGTTTTVNSATLDVTDANITVNNGGNQAGAAGAGLTVEMSDATDVKLIYDSATTSRMKVGDSGSEVEIATISGAQVITNKDIDGGTASNTSRLTVPKAAKATLDALTRKEATIVYASDQSKAYLDTGATLNEIGLVTSAVNTDINAVSTNYVILDADGFRHIHVTTGITDRSITLPTASANTDRVLTITKMDSAVGLVTILGDAVGETINGISGTTGFELKAQYDRVTLVCDGADWFIMDQRAASRIAVLGSNYNVTGSWVNTGITITIPAGTWNLKYIVTGRITSAAGDGNQYYGLRLFDGSAAVTSSHSAHWQDIDTTTATVANSVNVQVMELEVSPTTSTTYTVQMIGSTTGNSLIYADGATVAGSVLATSKLIAYRNN